MTKEQLEAGVMEDYRFNYYENGRGKGRHSEGEPGDWDRAEQRAKDLMRIWGCERVEYFESSSPRDKSWVYADEEDTPRCSA